MRERGVRNHYAPSFWGDVGRKGQVYRIVCGRLEKAVLNALAGCGEDELGLLVDLMLRPFGWDRDGAGENASSSMGGGDKQITGFLTLLGDELKSLGLTIGLTSAAQACVAGLEEEETNFEEVEGLG
jgi:Down-regulated in metastasis